MRRATRAAFSSPYLGMICEVFLVRVVDEVDPAARVVVGARLLAVLLRGSAGASRAAARCSRRRRAGPADEPRAWRPTVPLLQRPQQSRISRSPGVASMRSCSSARMLVRVVVEGAVDELDLASGASSGHALDLVAQHLAADDRGGCGSHGSMVAGPTEEASPRGRRGGRPACRAAGARFMAYMRRSASWSSVSTSLPPAVCMPRLAESGGSSGRGGVASCDGVADLVAHRAGAVLVGARHEHDELVAAVAGDDVAVAAARGEQCGQVLELTVAGMMAEAVVHRLEIVHVEEQDAGLAAVAARAP